MFGHAFVIGAVLAAQVGTGNERYPPPRATDQPTAGNTTPGNTNGSSLPPLDNRSAPAAGVSNRNPTSSSGAATSPYRTSPPPGVSAPPRTIPLIDSTSPPAATNQTQAAPFGFQSPQNAPTNQSASAQPAAGMKPSAMMKAMLSTPRDSQLPGNSVTLVEVLSGAKSRSEQTQRVEAYWDLCSSVADYYLGLREREEIRDLRSQVSRPGTAWQQAETELSTRVGTSQRAALVSQLRVASLMGRGNGNLPLPADMPHCASYNSHFDEIFAGRASTEAKELATLLPLRYAELKDAAAAVTRAEQWMDAVAAARNENSDGTGSLRALELLALHRRAFVQIARDYNRRIARYSELATPGQLTAERLTAILIKTANSSTATRSASPTPPRNRQSSNTPPPSLPRTFAEKWTPADKAHSDTTTRDEAVQPTSAIQSSPRKEKSLLVAPK